MLTLLPCVEGVVGGVERLGISLERRLNLEAAF